MGIGQHLSPVNGDWRGGLVPPLADGMPGADQDAPGRLSLRRSIFPADEQTLYGSDNQAQLSWAEPGIRAWRRGPVNSATVRPDRSDPGLPHDDAGALTT
ncbi:hypothetical protein AB0D13_36625 [Streptomyces sp. NPDC048430]|uniref:hypothetical protein n=1 Tax=Streptomyces sp. NPDC048430 TaxID=3155388 RepID=UPI00343EB764